MKLHEQIEKELRDFPVPYTLEPRRRHLFLRFEGRPLLCVGGMGVKTAPYTVRMTLSKLRQIRRAAMSSLDDNKHDD